jgi:hypothetical protein
MPEKISLGQMYNGPMSSATRFCSKDRFDNPNGLRTVLGWILPEWQRPFVWKEGQQVSWIRSVWLDIPLGTYTINMQYGSPYDGLLVDGQQRMRSLERYLNDEFTVLGYKWSEVTEVDRRFFEGTIWQYYEVRTDDEDYLTNYYNLLNFGGTPHTKDNK